MAEPKDKKLFYRIGEVCDMLDLEPYVLRYWQKEFPPLDPQKNSAGQRIYNQEDLKTVKNIRHLLYDEGFTIEGARDKLQQQDEIGDIENLKEQNEQYKKTIKMLRKKLYELKNLLEQHKESDG